MTATLVGLPALGVGLGFREPFRAELFQNRDQVDFLEITADHYFDLTPEKDRELELLARHFRLIPHGLDLSLGSAEGLDLEYLARFAELVQRIDPPYWSEHIAFTHAGGVEIGHLTPLPWTDEAIDVVVRNVEIARRRIDKPLILENITYTIEWPERGMDEAEFLTRLLDRTGCGWLLDVTNLYTNAINHGFDPLLALDRLPLERVVQLHFVGGHWRDGQLIDSHLHSTPPEVWRLLDEVVRRAPVKGVILERDGNFPPFWELLSELNQARRIMSKYQRWDSPNGNA